MNMSSLMISDLPERRALDRQAMAAVHGGSGWLAGLGPAAKVDVNVTQNIAQLQKIDVNALNNNGVIGAGFGPLKLDVNPKQWADAQAVV
jgi:hypothetical protein